MRARSGRNKGNPHCSRCSLEEVDISDGVGTTIGPVIRGENEGWLLEALTEVGGDVNL